VNQYKKVSFHTLGCKLNFSETSTIARLFENAGYAKVDFSDMPDVYVINTCSVTNNADKECKQLVKRAMKINPNAFVAIIGCYAQLKPNKIAAIPGVDLVLGANEKFNLLDYIDTNGKKVIPEIQNQEIKITKEFIPSYSFGERTRTFLKVQDGCDYFCAFCTIPLARGFSRSDTIEKTLQVANEVIKTGVKEIVLTGVNIGDFGKHHNQNFLQLIKALDETIGEHRFRISSIEPNLLSDDIIAFVARSKKFVPHFHIPLQSGSDKILTLMRRRYSSTLYASRIATIKKLMPDACIGVDVITGFPSETEEDFLTTYNFLQNLDISYLHVFTYSERANTTAIRINEVVPLPERQKRTKMLNILSDKKRRSFYESQLGKTRTVLFETEEENDTISGFTENYVKVTLPFDEVLINATKKIKLASIQSNGNVAGKHMNQHSNLILN
jgi:threonylcarbamoyladenosine tRNA methylthiotransferase MtaB